MLTLLALMIAAFCYLGFYRWDSAINRGRTTGYWSEFNRTSNTLSSIAGVRILKHWHNTDVTMEEFGFEIEVNNRPLPIFVAEKDAVRTMQQAEATTRLKALIEQNLTDTNSPARR